MFDDEKVNKVQQVTLEGVVQENTAVSPPENRVAPNKEQFDALMNEQKTQTEQTTLPKERLSLMETVRDLNGPGNAPGKVSTDSLIMQTKEAIGKIEEIKNTLDSPNAHIKSSTQQLLHNKLQHIDDNLHVALTRAGIEYSTPTAQALTVNPPVTGSPIERFLGFLTDGQFKLQNLGNELQAMSAQGQQLTPVNMLAVQVKVTQLQQELELFSTLLNKGLESIKTIMNIQV
jgi:hypothetical protein